MSSFRTPSRLRLEALPEPLSAGLVHLVSSSQPQQGENEHQVVIIHDGHSNALVDGAQRGLPVQTAPGPVELQPVCKVLGLLANPDELHDWEELLVAIELILLLQHLHEEEAETGLHHHPVLAG